MVYNREDFCGHWISTQTSSEEKGIALLLEPTVQFYDSKKTEKEPVQNRNKFFWVHINLSSG